MPRWIFPIILVFTLIPIAAQDALPTLADFWDGRAEWLMDAANVGLPVGESDTVRLPDGTFWSYLHASDRSAGVVDSCGQPVSFPGCTTLWRSADGLSFNLPAPVCLMACSACPCDDARDHITAQQYPRVAFAYHPDGRLDRAYMVYEWHAQTRFRASADGITWSVGLPINFPSGTWHTDFAACDAVARVGAHPNIQGESYNCLVGAPPGIFLDGEMLYLFVGAGSAPANMRCYVANRHDAERDPSAFTRL